MNDSNQTILHIKAGHLAPTDMLEFLLKKQPNAVGFMVQEPDAAPLQTMNEDATNLELKTLLDFQQEAKDRPKSLYFGKLADGYNPEDIQPITVEDPDNNKLLGVMLEGDVSTVFDDKTHTEHHQYLHTILLPKIVSWFEAFDGDVKEVMKQFERESFKKTFLASIGHRAVLHILPNEGHPFMFGKNNLVVMKDWGWVSHAEGYGVQAAAPVVVKPKAGYGWGGNKQPTKANADKPTMTVKDAATPGTAPRASVPASKPKEEKTLAEGMFVRPPSWLHKNDDIKLFYNILTGGHPATWKKRTPVTPTQNLDFLQVANYDDFKKYQLEKLMKTSTSAATKAERLSSTATPGTVPPLELPVHGPTDPTPLPIIEPDKLAKVLDYVAKYLDGAAKEISDPAEIQKTEKEIHPFTEQVGLKGLEETMNWPVSGLFGLGATDVRAIVLYAIQWRAYARPFLLAELKAKKKDGVTMTTETKVTTTEGGAIKTESVAKPAKAKASGGWGYGKKNAA